MKKSHSGEGRQVNIAVLKAELAKFLRLVRAGSEITVLDHKLPVARIVPVEAERGQSMSSVKPTEKFSEFVRILSKIKPPKLSSRKAKRDSLSLLLEDRSRR